MWPQPFKIELPKEEEKEEDDEGLEAAEYGKEEE